MNLEKFAMNKVRAVKFVQLGTTRQTLNTNSTTVPGVLRTTSPLPQAQMIKLTAQFVSKCPIHVIANVYNDKLWDFFLLWHQSFCRRKKISNFNIGNRHRSPPKTTIIIFSFKSNPCFLFELSVWYTMQKLWTNWVYLGVLGDCPAGTKRQTGDTGCDGCLRGQYQPQPYQTSCISCPANTFTRNVNSTKATDCESKASHSW